MPLKLSVLDVIPVREGQTSAQAIAASLTLAELADRLGFERYWFAEHHNMPAIASSSPPVLIAAAASRTRDIRLGSGGVMLPNHAPFTVAEQFAALEAIAPGRIDLGIGRAPGSDGVITALLRSSGPTSDVDRFEQNISDILLLTAGATTLSLRAPEGMRDYEVRATPVADGTPDVWLLGSSEYSAHLAARLGLPYVFAHHFSGEGTAAALEIYRREFLPSADLAAPRTFLTVNAVVADTAEEAEARALPWLQVMARLRTGGAPVPVASVEQAARTEIGPAGRTMIEDARAKWLVGTIETVGDELERLAGRFGVDEVMISATAGSREGEPLDRSVGRERTLELLAGRFPATSPAA